MRFFYASILLVLAFNLSSQNESSLVAHYTFTGNAEDSSGNQNHGSADGPTLTTDRFGETDSAYEFDGEDDIIGVLDAPSLRLEDDFTIVAWVMPYSTKDHTILRKNSSANNISATPAYGIGLSGTSHFVMNIGTDEGRTGISSQQAFFNQPYDTNIWYRMIARKQDSIIYITTNPFNKNTFTNYQTSMKGNILYDGSPLIIGSRTQQQSNTFEGKIDDIKIYNKFMTIEEITGLSFDDDDPEEEMMDDPDLENDIDFVIDVEIIGEPWKFLLLRLPQKTLARVRLLKEGELIIDREFDSNIVSLNIEELEAGNYLLNVMTSGGDYEQSILIE